MREHQNVVRRHMQVELEIIHLHMRVFRTAAERRQRLLRELARAAAVRRDRRFTGDERVVRFVLLQIFRIRTMMELRNADNCNHNYDAEQHEKAPADDFFDFHDDSPDCHICIIYGQSHFIIFSAAPSRGDTHDGCEKCRRLVKTMRHPPYIGRAHTPVSAGIYSNSIHSLEVPV